MSKSLALLVAGALTLGVASPALAQTAADVSPLEALFGGVPIKNNAIKNTNSSNAAKWREYQHEWDIAECNTPEWAQCDYLGINN